MIITSDHLELISPDVGFCFSSGLAYDKPEDTDEGEEKPSVGETVKKVFCQECSTEVGAMDEEEIYHFFNVLPSES